MNISIKLPNDICIATNTVLKNDATSKEVEIENFNKKNVINVRNNEAVMGMVSVVPSHDLNSRELGEGLQFVESLNESPLSKKCGELKNELCNILADNPTSGISFVRSTTVESGNVILEFKVNLIEELNEFVRAHADVSLDGGSDGYDLKIFLNKNSDFDSTKKCLNDISNKNGVICQEFTTKDGKIYFEFKGNKSFCENFTLNDKSSLELFEKNFQDSLGKTFEDYHADDSNMNNPYHCILDRFIICLLASSFDQKKEDDPSLVITFDGEGGIIRALFQEDARKRGLNSISTCCTKWERAPKNNIGVSKVMRFNDDDMFSWIKRKFDFLCKTGLLTEHEKNAQLRYLDNLMSNLNSEDPVQWNFLVDQYMDVLYGNDVEYLERKIENLEIDSDAEYVEGKNLEKKINEDCKIVMEFKANMREALISLQSSPFIRKFLALAIFAKKYFCCRGTKKWKIRLNTDENLNESELNLFSMYRTGKHRYVETPLWSFELSNFGERGFDLLPLKNGKDMYGLCGIFHETGHFIWDALCSDGVDDDFFSKFDIDDIAHNEAILRAVLGVSGEEKLPFDRIKEIFSKTWGDSENPVQIDLVQILGLLLVRCEDDAYGSGIIVNPFNDFALQREISRVLSSKNGAREEMWAAYLRNSHDSDVLPSTIGKLNIVGDFTEFKNFVDLIPEKGTEDGSSDALGLQDIAMFGLLSKYLKDKTLQEFYEITPHETYRLEKEIDSKFQNNPGNEMSGYFFRSIIGVSWSHDMVQLYSSLFEIPVEEVQECLKNFHAYNLGEFIKREIRR